MLLFRSEEHAGRWEAAAGTTGTGRVVTLPQAWTMALGLFGGRRERHWRRSAAQAREAFAAAGLMGPVWDVPDDS